MYNANNARQQALAVVAALAVSTTVILGTVGPVNAGPSQTEQVQLADANTDRDQAHYA